MVGTAVRIDQESDALTLRQLNQAGRLSYLALFFAEHALGRERFERLLGDARKRHRAAMLARLARFPRDRRSPVREVTFRTHAEFFRDPAAAWEPVVFRGLAKEWPAIGKWTPEFFGDQYAETPVAMIDQSGLYSDAERRRYEISTLGRLVASIRRGEKECLRFSAVIDENPELRHDLDMEWLSGFRSRWSLRGYPQFFLAPGGTYTPVHCAMESNAFVQVHGQKHWILQSAMYQPLLDPPADRMPYFRTDFLPEQPSAQFPLGPYAPGMEVVLDPGDVLYVPPFVWHYVENLTATIAVAYRFFYIRHALRSSWPLTLAKALATRPSLFHTLVCPRRSLEKRCQVDGCPFALPDAS